MGDPSAWSLVGDAADAAGVSIAALTELQDAERIGNVLRHVWGEELMDTGVLRAAQHAGGLLYGAEAGASWSASCSASPDSKGASTSIRTSWG